MFLYLIQTEKKNEINPLSHSMAAPPLGAEEVGNCEHMSVCVCVRVCEAQRHIALALIKPVSHSPSLIKRSI